MSDALTPRHRFARLAGVWVLCAIGAELLAAYGDSTGHPVQVAFLLVFFGALYGAPALLARELVRRRGWGWPSLLLVLAALGVMEACLIDQSLFSTDYQGYAGWEQSRAATLIRPLGISGFDAYNFVIGHLIFSFAAPLALAEAWSPEQARAPWLPPWGIVLLAACYVGAAIVVHADPTSHSASTAQLIVSAGVVLALLAAAMVIGRTRRSRVHAHRRLPLAGVLGVALLLALLAGMAPETWPGLALGLGATAAVGVAVLVAVRRTDWSIRHSAAVGLAFLLSRGIWAFSYFPLLGQMAPGPKYAHNTVMLLAVLAAGWLALRPRSARSRDRPLESTA